MERVLTDLLKRLLVFLLWRAGSRAGVDWRRAGRRYHLHPGPQLTRGHMSAHGLRLLQMAASQAVVRPHLAGVVRRCCSWCVSCGA